MVKGWARLLTGLLLTFATAAAALEPMYQDAYTYGVKNTLRLKVYRPLSDGAESNLEARLLVFHQAASAAGEWKPIGAEGEVSRDQGWVRFRSQKASKGRSSVFATPGNGVQLLCDLPLGIARKRLASPGYGRWVRLQVRRKGLEAWWQGSWQGEFVPPAEGGVLTWTYWLPNTPPPWQSTGGLFGILGLITWVGCIAAVRAEGRGKGWWRHAGWLHLPGAIAFFITHQAPPNTGLGPEIRNIRSPRLVKKRNGYED